MSPTGNRWGYIASVYPGEGWKGGGFSVCGEGGKGFFSW